MPKFKISSLKKLKLSDVFDDEMDFSNELSENHLKKIEEIIEAPLENPKTEEPVGRYYSDIVCDIKGSEKKDQVIIENKFNSSDHQHLGQCVTYASVKKAKIVVWICEDFTDEHIAALEWLNEHFGDEVNFYGIKVEVYDSSPDEKQINFIQIVKPYSHVFIESDTSKPYHSSRQKFFGKTLEKYNKISSIPTKAKTTIKDSLWVYQGDYVGIDLSHSSRNNIIRTGLKIWDDTGYTEKWRDETFSILDKNKEKIQSAFEEIRWNNSKLLVEGSRRLWGFDVDETLSDKLENIDKKEMEQISEKFANRMKKMIDLIKELKLES